MTTRLCLITSKSNIEDPKLLIGESEEPNGGIIQKAFFTKKEKQQKVSLQRNILVNLFSLQGKGGGEIFVIVYYDWSSYLTSVVNFLTPPQRSAGVLIRMSQSTTKIFPSSERMTFSSCKSLK